MEKTARRNLCARDNGSRARIELSAARRANAGLRRRHNRRFVKVAAWKVMLLSARAKFCGPANQLLCLLTRDAVSVCRQDRHFHRARWRRFFAELAENHQTRRVHVAITRFEGEELVQKISPPLRLLVFGDGPDNAPFRSLGHFLGWDIIEIIDANLFSIVPDAWTAAIVKSHNYGRDFVTLQKLLPLELRYVGLIGPRKRRDQIMSELLEVGITVNAVFLRLRD